MASNGIDPTRIMAQALDGLALRQRVTANNVANADTPRFKASRVTFEETLRQRLHNEPGGNLNLVRTHAAHLPVDTADDASPARIVEMRGTTMRNDGNNVDIEQQMGILAETTMRYSAVSEALARKLAIMRTIASDGRQ
ncbi:flagellar basal body rod protein FlgB [Sphaerobacter sp.]|uniref:flagellar basal body rod protein FlgB n=1 Tax=Sphaerobacter sp. TaxID=2099654 RepID=UPI001DE0DC03|nr:flagellar basal body rod protein FlgB [Sphaerobacter sp.]MBX5446286.1 flagellar basal body rod protein FlgB [Sphaerobacter sp.]